MLNLGIYKNQLIAVELEGEVLIFKRAAVKTHEVILLSEH